MSRLHQAISFLTFAAFQALNLAQASETTPIFPIDEIEPGQRGMWRTVVQGSEIREFELEILGVVDNALGPRRPAIIAQATDPENILSGPVAGMSGSPVFIDGRLVGAYAFGYIWPKEQAIIGITPIAQMLEIRDFGQSGEGNVVSGSPVTREPASGSESLSAGGRASFGTFDGDVLTQLPVPLTVGGVSSRSLEVFADAFERLGLSPMQGLTGSSGDIDPSRAFAPGDPVAAVLMTGDFSAAATGTVTWVEDDELIAFGHPFLQWGSVDMPMAHADIITVVRNARLSFKMSNIGPVVGSIRQDRLTGIAGRVGEVPEMAQLQVTVNRGDASREYRASLYKQRDLTPLMTGMAVLEALQQVMETHPEETFEIAVDAAFSGKRELDFSTTVSGPGAEAAASLDLYTSLLSITGNPFEPVELEAVSVTIDSTPSWLNASLKQVRLLTARARPGETIEAAFTFQGYRDASFTRTVKLKVPPSARAGDRFELVVGDAMFERNRTGAYAPDGSLDDILARVGNRPDQTSAYAYLLKQSEGIEVAGRRLESLPPSVRAEIADRTNQFPSKNVSESVVDRATIELGAPFFGFYRVPVTVE